jgi:hypothetical protein
MRYDESQGDAAQANDYRRRWKSATTASRCPSRSPPRIDERRATTPFSRLVPRREQLAPATRQDQSSADDKTPSRRTKAIIKMP